jgi:ATP-dependent DNA ligase
LEGIVAKHRDGRYDARAQWITIKNPAYTQCKQRHELFDEPDRRDKDDKIH